MNARCRRRDKVDTRFFKEPSSLLSQPVRFFLVLHPQEERPMAGFREGEYHNIPVKPDGDRGHPDDMRIKDLEPRLDLSLIHISEPTRPY